jgi:two-component system NtrC family response regulator
MALVLLVVDEPAVREGVAAIIRRTEHEVSLASSCRDALEQARARSFDVVLANIQLPDGGGLDLLPLLRQSYPCPEVIIMTSRADGDEAERAIKSGAWDYVQHPSEQDTVTLSLTRALQYQEEKRSLGLPISLKRDRIVGNSAATRDSLDLVAQAAGCLANVLISGETGTGKELYAAAIHDNSTRAAGNFVVVDCSALPANIVESVLFGHEKGAYTGADRAHEGLAAQANRGTLFLDEVGELPRDVQNSFLRVIQERRFRSVGGSREIRSDFRLIAATNRSLDEMVERGEFRADLLYRLRTIAIALPALRQHKEDIKALALHFVARTCEQYGLEMKGFTPEFFSVLGRYDWPGNVRELSQALERAIASAGSRPLLYPMDLPTDIRAKLARDSAGLLQGRQLREAEASEDAARALPRLAEARTAAIAAAEREYLRDLLTHTGDNVSRACAISGLSRSRLYSLLKKHGMAVPRSGTS